MFNKLAVKILANLDQNEDFYRRYFPWLLNLPVVILGGDKDNEKSYIRLWLFMAVVCILGFIYSAIHYEKIWAVFGVLGILVLASLLSPIVRRKFINKDDRVSNCESWLRIISFATFLIFIGAYPNERETIEKNEKEAAYLKKEREEKAEKLNKTIAEIDRLHGDLSFKAEYSRLAAPKIMFECNGSTRYLASTGITNYNGLLMQAKSECGGDFTLISGEK